MSTFGTSNLMKYTISWHFLTFVILTLSSFFVIFYPDTLPLYDYPGHIARLYVLKLNGSDPIIAQHITVHWHYVTNLALEIVTYPLMQLFEPDTVGRMFICFSFMITTSGTIFLHRTLGGTGPWPYIVFLLIFNDILLYGFLSFLFSVGLVLWAFAFWLKARSMHFRIKLVLFIPICLLLLTFHLFAFCLYALLVGSYEIAGVIERHKKKAKLFSENFIIGALQFVPALVIFFLISETSTDAPLVASTVLEKLAGIASIISLYNIKLQITAVTLVVIFLLFLWKKNFLILAPKMYLFVIIGAMVFLLAPRTAFGSFFLDFRMPVALLLPVIAAIQVNTPRVKSSLFRLAIISVCLTQYLYIGMQWSKFDKTYDDMFTVTNTLKAGDRLFHVAIGRGSNSENLAPPLIHSPAYLMVSKRAVTPFVFADARHQPISYIHPDIVPDGVTSLIYSGYEEKLNTLKEALAGPLAANFDYLLLANFESAFLEQSREWQLVSEKGIFKLYKNISHDNI